MPATSLLPVLVAAEETRQLPMPPIAFGLIAFVAFLLGLGVLWSFRNTAAKVADREARVRAAQEAARGGAGARGGQQPGGRH